jgi:hypothetical protein
VPIGEREAHPPNRPRDGNAMETGTPLSLALLVGGLTLRF